MGRMNTFLQLGDSYTIGEGLEAGDRWGHQLADALRKEGVAITDPHIVATTGWSTGELLARLNALEPLGNDWGLVSVLAGVNNQYRGLPLDDYHSEFSDLLSRAIAYAREGADVAICYHPREESDAETVIRLIEAEGRRAVALPADLKDEKAARQVVDEVPVDVDQGRAIRLLMDNVAFPELVVKCLRHGNQYKGL